MRQDGDLVEPLVPNPDPSFGKLLHQLGCLATECRNPAYRSSAVDADLFYPIHSTEDYSARSLDTMISIPNQAVDKDDEKKTSLELVKLVLAYIALFGKVLACTFRFVVARDFTFLFLSIPYLNDMFSDDAKIYIMDTVGGIFMLLDMAGSAIAMRPEVKEMCAQKNWLDIIKSQLTKIRRHQYPLKLWLPIIVSGFGVANRGYVGLSVSLQELDSVSRFYFLSNFYAGWVKLIVCVYAAVASSICFFAFQGKKALWIHRATQDGFFDKNNAQWKKFIDHPDASVFRKSNRYATFTAIFSVIFASVAPLYNDAGKFEFNPIRVSLFFSILLPNFIYNFLYGYRAVYLIDLVEQTHHQRFIQQKCTDCNDAIPSEKKETPQSCIERIAHWIKLFNSVGNGLTFSPAFTRFAQTVIILSAMALHKDQLKEYSENHLLIALLLLFATPAVYYSVKLNIAMWANKVKLPFDYWQNPNVGGLRRSLSAPAF